MDDLDLIPPERREWWSAYRESHADHVQTLIGVVGERQEVGALLDVGNYPGHFTVVAAEAGWNVAGIDLHPDRAGGLWEKHGIDERQADIETEPFPFGDDTFDVVVLAEVLEHLRLNPIHALRECRRVLKPKGSLVLSVPNVSVIHRVRFLLGMDYQGDVAHAFRKLEQSGHMGHWRLYTEPEIANLLDYTGFRIQIVRMAGHLPAGKWRFIRYTPMRNRVRSHMYVVAGER